MRKIISKETRAQKNKQNQIIIGVVCTITISVFLAGYFILKQNSIIINEKTVMVIGRKYGYDMDNPDRFGKQVHDRYRQFSPDQRRKAFYIIMSQKKMPQIVKCLSSDLRRVTITQTAEWLKEYRQNMTGEEREKLRTMIESSKGQDIVGQAKYAYFEGYNAEERAEIKPVVEEILKILSKM